MDADPDKLAMTLFIVGVLYTWGCLNRGWTSPLDIGVGIICRMGGHRWCGHQKPSSQGCGPDEVDTSVSVPTPSPQGPLRPPQTLHTPAAGPLSIEDLTHHVQYPRDPSSTDRQQGESGPAWTRRMLDSGLLGPGEIDQIGAAKLGVHPDTVRRWRRQLGGTQTTTNGDPQP